MSLSLLAGRTAVNYFFLPVRLHKFLSWYLYLFCSKRLKMLYCLYAQCIVISLFADKSEVMFRLITLTK